jgi:asparagine synthase (glutamine-hydrolysing)
MCGILFQFRAEGCEVTRFNAARDRMAHRGPDAAHSVFLEGGKVGLGHRRLSIIDLSERADQPMQRDDLWIVYNGEIYNFRELRNQLEQRGHRFRTQSDTEVLLLGYQEWGRDLCHYLHGMFAFAIWDGARKKAFLARDHVGQKPLYYWMGDREFVAASELPALYRLAPRSLSVRWESVPELLYYSYIPEPYTWFRGVLALEPGHWMEVSCEGEHVAAKTSAYWTFMPDPDPAPLSEQQAREVVGTEIEQAVRSHLVADVEVGAFLSGGVDSACVVAVAARLADRPLKTFCLGMGDEKFSEAPRAREVAAFIGTQHFEETTPTPNFRAAPEDVLALFGQPFADYSLVPTRQIAQTARSSVKCVLTGDGGDEVWGGYAHYPTHVRFPPLAERSLRGLWHYLKLRARGLKRWQDHFDVGHVMVTPAQAIAPLSQDFVKSLGDYDVTWYARKYWLPQLDPFRRAQWVDIKTYLPSDILVKVDRCSMSCSLETRPPFLSHRLIEKVLNLPANIKNPNGQLKSLFKKWLRGRVPEAILSAPKTGFGVLPAQFPGLPVPTQLTLERCVAEGVVERRLVEPIARFAYASWKFQMIETMLAGVSRDGP